MVDQEQTENDICIPTKLAAGPIVPSLEDYTAATLPETLIRAIKYARITIILLEKESSVKARYEVFKRLNKLGSPLSDQEIRNCTARLWGKNFRHSSGIWGKNQLSSKHCHSVRKLRDVWA